jgi:hypothetical protein
MDDLTALMDWRLQRQSVTREVTNTVKEMHLPPQLAEAFSALSEAIQLLQSRDLEKEQRISSIEARLEKANAILRGAA